MSNIEITPKQIDMILDEYEQQWQPMRFRDFLKIKLFGKKTFREGKTITVTLIDNTQITFEEKL